jgi:hypothetical protein
VGIVVDVGGDEWRNRRVYKYIQTSTRDNMPTLLTSSSPLSEARGGEERIRMRGSCIQ